MAWSYQVSHAASTATLVGSKSQSFAFTYSSSCSRSARPNSTATSGTWVTAVEEYGSSGSSSHTLASFGTGGAKFTFTGTVTGWHSWDVWTFNSVVVATESSVFTSSFSEVHVIGTSTVTWLPVQIRLSITHISESTRDERLFGGTHLYREGRTTRLSVSEWFTNVTNTSGGTATQSTSFTGQTTFSQTGSFANPLSYVYPSTTALSSTDITNTVTAETTVSYTIPTSKSGGGLTTASSTHSVTTSATVATTTSIVSSQFATITDRPLFETVWHLDWTDWGWKTTTTGDGEVTVVAASFTGDSTFSCNQESYTLPTVAPVSVTESEQRSNNSSTVNTVGITHTYNDAFTTSSSFAHRVTTQSTYAIGTPTADAGMVPLTAFETVTRRYTTTVPTTLTWHAITTNSYSETSRTWQTAISTMAVYTMTVSTTGGDPVTTLTTTTLNQSLPEWNQPDQSNGTTTSISTGVNFSGRSVAEQGYSQSVATIGLRHAHVGVSVLSAGAPSFMKAAVAGGFQVWGAHGIGSIYGTNISASPPVQVGGFGHIFPNVILPLLDQEPLAYTVGTDAYTSRYVVSESAIHLTSKSSTHSTDTAGVTISLGSEGGVTDDKSSIRESAQTIGGHGWKRLGTDFSQLSASHGMHSYTSYDSAGGSTASTTRWNETASTHDISHGNAINLETVPLLSVAPATLTTDNPIVATFSAYPE